VLAIRFADRTILLPGDLEPPGTQAILAQTPLRCDVIMAPHHGSLAAQAERVIAWAKPTWVVVSGSARAATPRVIDAFTPADGSLLITARDHAIRAEIDGRGSLRMMRWSQSSWRMIQNARDDADK
jgi:competence protein ComEC